MRTVDVILAASRRLPESEQRRLVAALKTDDGERRPCREDTQRGYVVRHWPDAAADRPCRLADADADRTGPGREPGSDGSGYGAGAATAWPRSGT
jgi:hypothetical protein